MTAVAYLINQYPKVSHSFVRREILALERLGLTVLRFGQRGWDEHVVDPDDQAELARTQYLLQGGGLALLAATCKVAVAQPLRFLGALRMAWRMSRQSDRSAAVHFIYLAEAACLLLGLQRQGATHLHAHFGTNSAEIALLCKLMGGPPFSFTVHGPDEFDQPLSLHLGEKMAHCKFVAAVSSFGKSQLMRWAQPADWPKIKVVHCGIEKGWQTAVPPVAPPSNVLVCVGRLAEQKGQLLLLEAFRQALDGGANASLVLAGDGPMRPVIEAAIVRLNLQQHVRITGWISGAQVRQEIIHSRALVLPSFAEGLPVVIMEAMALGRPVLTTYIAGIPELVRHGENGWLFPAGDVQAIAAAISQCMAVDAEQLCAMGERAHERVVLRHDVDTEASKLLALFGGSGAAETSSVPALS